ncbi:MAG: hypothetical protein EAZ89_19335 [Bacteroidetes bacterium]|nr:MAG: hypothetical protein EAZ89_19335 [Bacteroidota bacterium]
MRRDAYRTVPLGSALTKEILAGAEQIVMNDSDLIVVYNTEDITDEEWALHVLFYDSTMTFYSASYFASRFIDTIRNGQIEGHVNSYMYGRKELYRNDLPAAYKIRLKQPSVPRRGSDIIALIQRIELDTTGEEVRVRFFVNTIDSLIWNFRSTTSSYSVIPTFPVTDTLIFPLEKLSFDHISYSTNSICIVRYERDSTTNNATKKLVRRDSRMFVDNATTLDTFYEDLYQYFMHKKRELPPKTSFLHKWGH